MESWTWRAMREVGTLISWDVGRRREGGREGGRENGWCQCINHPPSDGRTKTKLTVDGRCRLLLIREETGGPSRQVSLWADVLMYVFSYADLDSLREVSCVM